MRYFSHMSRWGFFFFLCFNKNEMKPKLIKKAWALLFMVALSQPLYAQFTQVVKGKVSDGVLDKGIGGAVVQIMGTEWTTVTDEAGMFRFNGVKVGTYQLRITHIGYRDGQLEGVVVNSGKEVMLNISLETQVRTEREIIVKAASKKNKPVNDMSLVSARAFTVEET